MAETGDWARFARQSAPLCGHDSEPGGFSLSLCAMQAAPLRERPAWRRRRDSNPRYGFPYDALAKRWFQPLTHVSGSWQEAGYSGDFRADQRKLHRSLPGKRMRGYHGCIEPMRGGG